jgi:hypothetical protein
MLRYYIEEDGYTSSVKSPCPFGHCSPYPTLITACFAFPAHSVGRDSRSMTRTLAFLGLAFLVLAALALG